MLDKDECYEDKNKKPMAWGVAQGGCFWPGGQGQILGEGDF